jgi:hypothetical protein
MNMLSRRVVATIKFSLLAAFMASGVTASSLLAQPPAATSPATVTSHPSSRYRPDHPPKKAEEFFKLVWGIDSFSVKSAESGELIRFSYRVLDPVKARILNDKKVDAFLDSPKAHARLVIPSLEKVGQLRQGNTPEAGKSYWMAFSNPRRTVRSGDHVNVVIGTFHADGLVVE